MHLGALLCHNVTNHKNTPGSWVRLFIRPQHLLPDNKLSKQISQRICFAVGPQPTVFRERGKMLLFDIRNHAFKDTSDGVAAFLRQLSHMQQCSKVFIFCSANMGVLSRSIP